MKVFNVGFAEVLSTLVSPDVVEDGRNGVDDGLHRREDTRGDVRTAAGQEVVGCSDESSDMDIDQSAVRRHGELVGIRFRCLKEEL